MLLFNIKADYFNQQVRTSSTPTCFSLLRTFVSEVIRPSRVRHAEADRFQLLFYFVYTLELIQFPVLFSLALRAFTLSWLGPLPGVRSTVDILSKSYNFQERFPLWNTRWTFKIFNHVPPMRNYFFQKGSIMCSRKTTLKLEEMRLFS